MSDIIPDDKATRDTIAQIASHYEAIIRLIGEDPSREGLVKTPMRAAKALYYATKGYRTDLDEIVNGAMFTHTAGGLIVVRDIEFYSFCEHHILPFFGTVSIGYLPNGRIIGRSKMARIVDMFARRLQVQERLTDELCREITKLLDAHGVIVHCRAQHLCMKMRGVEKQNSATVTIEASGLLLSDHSRRAEFFEAIR
ncbi:MAG: GTP cyclohydrolase I FolE [Paramuribaculum sp.]|nr:GTP cyclohydrolase I FolE [Paramuribaculum sp.]